MGEVGEVLGKCWGEMRNKWGVLCGTGERVGEWVKGGHGSAGGPSRGTSAQLGEGWGCRGTDEPQLEGLRELHCEEGLKMAAWGGGTSVERERYWSFMPKGAKADCE